MQARGILSCLLIATFSISGCATSGAERVSYRKMIRLNSANVTLVNTGMTKDEVVRLMGSFQSRVRSGPIENPWKVEFFGDVEILHYITSGHPPFMPIMASQATPVVLKNDRVFGVGRGVLKEIKTSASFPAERRDGSSFPNVEDRLRTLKKLYDEGLIDQDAYEEQRTRILESI